MKSCPGCSFLMGDDETLCESCDAQNVRRAAVDAAAMSVGSGGGGAATLLLAPPAATPLPQTVRYRSPDRGRKIVRAAVAFTLPVVAFGALAVMGLRGDGPLADTAVDLGLADPPAVDVPDHWSTLTSPDNSFSVSLPAGAEEHDEAVDSTRPELGAASGFDLRLGTQGSMAVWSSGLGLPEGSLDAVDDAGLHRLVDEIVASERFGTETVRRDAVVAAGRAVDSVLLVGEDSTVRARFLVAAGRFHVVMTVGPEEGARDLNAAHQRVLRSFDPRV